jgi:hypothetical protein
VEKLRAELAAARAEASKHAHDAETVRRERDAARSEADDLKEEWARISNIIGAPHSDDLRTSVVGMFDDMDNALSNLAIARAERDRAVGLLTTWFDVVYLGSAATGRTHRQCHEEVAAFLGRKS